jgi:hypothetical protein
MEWVMALWRANEFAQIIVSKHYAGVILRGPLQALIAIETPLVADMLQPVLPTRT